MKTTEFLTCRDLMVGDLVKIKEEIEHYGGCIAQIIELGLHPTDFSFYLKAKVRKTDYTTELDLYNKDLVPIPLSNDIFIKNGFTESKYSILTGDGFKTYPEYKYINRKEQNNPNRNIVRVACNDLDDLEYFLQLGVTTHIYNLRYVHELQDALRICKIDKNIEL